MYIKVNDGNAVNYSIAQLKKDNSSVSFPKEIPSEILSDFDVYQVVIQEKPDITASQKAEMNSTPTFVNGEWVYEWSISNKTQQEIDFDNDSFASNIRRIRDSLLAKTDWYALSDVTMSAEMAAYRQALRDITNHADFPYLTDEDWPEAP